MDILRELERAVRENDPEKIERLRRRLLLDDRDESVDKDFVDSIRGNGSRNKTLYVNLRKALNQNIKEDWIWYAKLVSSLITHILIESQVRDRDIRDYPIVELYSLLGDFILNKEDRDTTIGKCRDFINTRYFSFVGD